MRGPEDGAFSSAVKLYFAETVAGRIVRLNPDGSELEIVFSAQKSSKLIWKSFATETQKRKASGQKIELEGALAKGLSNISSSASLYRCT